jgi:hypothetical protein
MAVLVSSFALVKSCGSDCLGKRSSSYHGELGKRRLGHHIPVRGGLRISLDRLGLWLIGRSFAQAMERPRDTGKAEAAQIVAAEFSDSTLPAILST